ncbi:hypothetical protein [Nocardia sp. NPDC046763]|uniref:hypothetical protein n=1 Tax=Nocardia sp. NPDC046763 TaxID=3155256 RepID=UPI0033E4D2E5
MTTADRLRAEGEVKGRIKERAEMLIEQLSLEFGALPSQIIATVHTADLDRLRAWATRARTAGSLDEIFQK